MAVFLYSENNDPKLLNYYLNKIINSEEKTIVGE